MAKIRPDRFAIAPNQGVSLGDNSEFDSDDDFDESSESPEEGSPEEEEEECEECRAELAQQAHDIIAAGDPEICDSSGEHSGDETLRRLHDFLVGEGAKCPGMPDEE